MADVKVDPGNIEEFGKRMAQLADAWEDKNSAPYEVLNAGKGMYGYPTLGEFAEADQFRTQYSTKRNEVAGAFNAMYKLLDGLADASKDIAKNYRDTEALNAANAQKIEQMLDGPLSKASTPSGKGTPPDSKPPAA